MLPKENAEDNCGSFLVDMRNGNLRYDLDKKPLNRVIKMFWHTFLSRADDYRLCQYVNVSARQLLDNTNTVRRLQTTKSFELM